LFVTIVSIVVFWEKQPLASLWLKPLQWQSIAWAGGLFLASNLLIFPATEWIRNALGLAGYEAGMERIMSLPVWFRIVAAVTAGIVEETLFRGFAITRLAGLLRNIWLAAALSVIIFAVLHVPAWGAGPALAFLVGGATTTAFFLWRRDLLVMILAHIMADVWGLVIAPQYSAWWSR
jgi:membrane protease YdiL (CAAX protease family)